LKAGKPEHIEPKDYLIFDQDKEILVNPWNSELTPTELHVFCEQYGLSSDAQYIRVEPETSIDLIKKCECNYSVCLKELADYHRKKARYVFQDWQAIKTGTLFNNLVMCKNNCSPAQLP